MPDNHGSTFTELFLNACSHYRDRPAFSCQHQTLTFGDIDDLSAGLAGYLRHSTILQVGDRVAVQIANTTHP